MRGGAPRRRYYPRGAWPDRAICAPTGREEDEDGAKTAKARAIRSKVNEVNPETPARRLKRGKFHKLQLKIVIIINLVRAKKGAAKMRETFTQRRREPKRRRAKCTTPRGGGGRAR